MRSLIAIITLTGCMAVTAFSQNDSGSSATTVSAEMTKGRLSPSESKPGDQVLLKLKDDVKSNGQLILKKGTTITGVVRNVSRATANGQANGQSQSVMQLEWLPPSSISGAQQLMIAVQSVTQINPMYGVRQESDSDWNLGTGTTATTAAGGGLLGGTLGSTARVTGGALDTTGSAVLRPNLALLSMPSVVAADAQTAASLQNTLGMTGDEQLFRTGHGQIITVGGSKESIDLFSHMNNDTVLTSKNKNFELTSGAQMQLLIGVRKN